MTQAQIQQFTEKETKKKIEKTGRIRFNIRVFNRCLTGTLVLLGLAYIACVNDMAIQGFRLSELKKELGSLSEDNSQLELQAMTLQSYSNISERVKKMNMVAVGQIAFIQPNTATVAKR